MGSPINFQSVFSFSLKSDHLTVRAIKTPESLRLFFFDWDLIDFVF